MSDGTHYDNWFTNSACTSGYRSTALPANGDSLIFTGTTAPSTASPTALTGIAEWYSGGLNDNMPAALSSNVTMGTGATLSIGHSGKVHIWDGDASANVAGGGGSIGLDYGAVNDATLGDTAELFGGSLNYGTMGDWCSVQSSIHYGTMGSYGAFSGTSLAIAQLWNIPATFPVMGDNTSFQDNASALLATMGNGCTIDGYTVYTGTVGDDCTFMGRCSYYTELSGYSIGDGLTIQDLAVVAPLAAQNAQLLQYIFGLTTDQWFYVENLAYLAPPTPCGTGAQILAGDPEGLAFAGTVDVYATCDLSLCTIAGQLTVHEVMPTVTPPAGVTAAYANDCTPGLVGVI